MKKGISIGFLLFFLLSGCTSSILNLTTTEGLNPPTVDVQGGGEKTRQYYAMQTIIAFEQATLTPTPNIPKPWTEITTLTPILASTPHSVIATAIKPTTPILLGPAYNYYRMACYVDKGVPLLITGRNIDSSWFRVTFANGQTCFLLDKNDKRTDIIPDPKLQLWIFSSMCTISGDLSEVAIIAPTGTPIPTTYKP